MSVVLPILDREHIQAAGPSLLEAVSAFEQMACRAQATEDDFVRLVKLLCHSGCSSEAEYLLRVNLLIGNGEELREDPERARLYVELFGTKRQKELESAITAFANRFSAQLSNRAGATFLVGYDCELRSKELKPYRLQNVPCAISFEYTHREHIQAELWSLKEEDQLIFLKWQKSNWKIIGTGYSCVVQNAPDP